MKKRYLAAKGGVITLTVMSLVFYLAYYFFRYFVRMTSSGLEFYITKDIYGLAFMAVNLLTIILLLLYACVFKNIGKPCIIVSLIYLMLSLPLLHDTVFDIITLVDLDYPLSVLDGINILIRAVMALLFVTAVFCAFFGGGYRGVAIAGTIIGIISMTLNFLNIADNLYYGISGWNYTVLFLPLAYFGGMFLYIALLVLASCNKLPGIFAPESAYLKEKPVRVYKAPQRPVYGAPAYIVQQPNFAAAPNIPASPVYAAPQPTYAPPVAPPPAPAPAPQPVAPAPVVEPVAEAPVAVEPVVEPAAPTEVLAPVVEEPAAPAEVLAPVVDESVAPVVEEPKVETPAAPQQGYATAEEALHALNEKLKNGEITAEEYATRRDRIISYL